MPTTAEGTLAELIAAINGPDPGPLEDFVQTRYADPARVGPLWASFRRTAAPVRVVRVDDAEPLALMVTLEDRWDRRLQYQLRLAAEPPHRLTPAYMSAAPPDDATLPPRTDWTKIEPALVAKLAQGVAEGRLSGAIKIVRHGETLFEAAYGLADREGKTPNQLGTRFRVGSMNKMITGVAVLQLAEAGRLGLDDPVARHLPDYPNRGFAEQVTLRHLLNHTGGAGDFFGPVFREHRLTLLDPADYVARLGHRDPEFTPGSQWRYANYGFILLGRLIEAVTGLTYDAYAQAAIFDVAGMIDTGALPENTPVPRRAVGYMDSPKGLVRSDATLPCRGTPAGGGYSTVGDLVRFGQALTGGRLLGAESMALLGAGGHAVAPGLWYGAGIQEQEQGGVRTFGHSGGAPGMNGDLIIHTGSGYIIAALANGDPPQANYLTQFVSLRLPA
jgi:CubicO group peptidase (beta-lactamase class C family)